MGQILWVGIIIAVVTVILWMLNNSYYNRNWDKEPW